jgi:hypothetical protein
MTENNLTLRENKIDIAESKLEVVEKGVDVIKVEFFEFNIKRPTIINHKLSFHIKTIWTLKVHKRLLRLVIIVGIFSFTWLNFGLAARAANILLPIEKEKQKNAPIKEYLASFFSKKEWIKYVSSGFKNSDIKSNVVRNIVIGSGVTIASIQTYLLIQENVYFTEELAQAQNLFRTCLKEVSQCKATNYRVMELNKNLLLEIARIGLESSQKIE